MWIFKAQQSCITLPNGNTWATHSNGKILAVFSVLNPAANGGWERVLQHALQTSRDSSRPAEMQVTDFSWEPALECLRTSLLCLYFWCSNNWRTAEALASAKCSVCSCGVGISWAARIPHTWQTGRLQSWAELGGHAVTYWHGRARAGKGNSSCGFLVCWAPVADKSTQHLADSDPQALAIRADENFIRSLLCHTVSAFPLGARWLNIACIFWVGLPKICLSLGFLPSCGEAPSAGLPGKKVGKGKGIQCSSQRSQRTSNESDLQKPMKPRSL